jgi:aminoglycoside 3-N-acetyltransferase I
VGLRRSSSFEGFAADEGFIVADPTTEYAFRQLSGRDAQLLKALLRVFGEAFADLPTYQDAVPSDAYLAELLDGTQFIALVALAGEEVIGGLAAYELIKFERERKEIYVYDLAVAADHRRRGMAKSLMNELKRIASERGAYVIFVQADPPDAPAVALYEALGTRETVYHFDIAVPKGHTG